MARTYFYIITNENAPNEKPYWAPQFGDKSRKVCDQEVVDSFRYLKRSNVKVIATNGSQKDLEAILAKLNA